VVRPKRVKFKVFLRGKAKKGATGFVQGFAGWSTQENGEKR